MQNSKQRTTFSNTFQAVATTTTRDKPQASKRLLVQQARVSATFFPRERSMSKSSKTPFFGAKAREHYSCSCPASRRRCAAAAAKNALKLPATSPLRKRMLRERFLRASPMPLALPFCSRKDLVWPTFRFQDKAFWLGFVWVGTWKIS